MSPLRTLYLLARSADEDDFYDRIIADRDAMADRYRDAEDETPEPETEAEDD